MDLIYTRRGQDGRRELDDVIFFGGCKLEYTLGVLREIGAIARKSIGGGYEVFCKGLWGVLEEDEYGVVRLSFKRTLRGKGVLREVSSFGLSVRDFLSQVIAAMRDSFEALKAG